MKDKLTMMLVTYRRHNLLKNALDYHSTYGFKIIVADGTDTPLEGAETYPNVVYLHTPNVDPKTRTHLAMRFVDTPYVVMRADRRHLLHTGLERCINFLEENLDYCAAQGLNYELGFKDGFQIHKRYQHDNSRGLPHKTAGERLNFLFSPYCPSFYSVYRTETWLKILKGLRVIKNYYLAELMQAILTSIYGKYKSIPCVYCLHNPNTGRINKDDPNYKLFGDLLLEERNEIELIAFHSYLYHRLYEESDKTLEESKHLVDHALKIYLKNHYPVVRDHLKPKKENTLNVGRSILELEKFVPMTPEDKEDLLRLWHIIRGQLISAHGPVPLMQVRPDMATTFQRR